MSMDNKVPKIRFKEFSGAWAENSVGKLCDFIVPGRTKPQIFDGVIPWVTTPDITSNCVSKSKIGLAISKDEAKRVGAKVVPKNSIIISCVGDLGLVAKADNELIINQQLHAFIPKENINKWFLLYELLTRKKHMENVATKTSVPYMNKDNCNSIPIIFPSVEEQTQIGDYFQKLDALINQHQQKHVKLSNIKRSMLEKMFPKQGEAMPEIRFKGFSGGWEEKVLGDEMTVTSVKRILQSDWTVSGVRFLRARDIVSAYKNEEPADYLYIAREKYNEYSQLSGKVEVGDLLVTGVGTIGVPMLITNGEPVYFKDGNIIWFKNENKIDGMFLFYSFVGDLIQTYIKHSAGTGTVGTYTINSGKNTPIKLPTREEQTAIGNYFQKLDALINQHQQQITKLNNIKQACLSKMFV